MKTLDLYIGRTILNHVLMVMAVLLGLFTFVSFIDELQDMGTGRYDLLEVVRFLVLTIPQRIYELFPMAALLGTISGLSTMAVDSELIIMRASGVSLLRITGSVLKVGAVFVVVSVLIGEFVTPTAETMAQRGRAEALRQSVKQHTDYGLWMRDQTTFISVGEVLPDLSLLNLRIFEFDNDRQLRSAVAAISAKFDEDRWLLTDVRQSLFEEDGSVRPVHVENAYWNSALTTEILSVFLVKPEQMSAWHLLRYIEHLHENAQETAPYELAFWNKLFQPFATAIMVVLAIPFVFRLQRGGGFGHRLFIGILLGLAFYLISKGFGYVVLVYGIPPIVGAVTPLIAFLMVALVMLRRMA
jgi:lipopolysaccharide export system permease protein